MRHIHEHFFDCNANPRYRFYRVIRFFELPLNECKYIIQCLNIGRKYLFGNIIAAELSFEIEHKHCKSKKQRAAY